MDRKLQTMGLQAVSLAPTSPTVSSFYSDKNASDKAYVEFFMFNVTNPQAVLKGDAPILDEIGPFTYRVVTDHFNVSWSDNGEVIEYETWNRYIFERSMSVADENKTVLCLPNILFQALVGATRHFRPELRGLVLKLAFDKMTDFQRMFEVRTVRQHLFGFYDKPLLSSDLVKWLIDLDERLTKQLFTGYFTGLVGNVTSQAKAGSKLHRKPHI